MTEHERSDLTIGDNARFLQHHEQCFPSRFQETRPWINYQPMQTLADRELDLDDQQDRRHRLYDARIESGVAKT